MDFARLLLVVAATIAIAVGAQPTRILCDKYRAICEDCFPVCNGYCYIDWGRFTYKESCEKAVDDALRMKSCLNAELNKRKVPVLVRAAGQSSKSATLRITESCALKNPITLKKPRKEKLRVCVMFWNNCLDRAERNDQVNFCSLCELQCLNEARLEVELSLVAFLLEKGEECRAELAADAKKSRKKKKSQVPKGAKGANVVKMAKVAKL